MRDWSKLCFAVAKTLTTGPARPPPRISLSTWADENRRLSAEASSEPGPWKTSKAPYQREIMDAISDRDIRQVVVMSSAQVGKTEMILNTLGYHVAWDPCPVLAVMPTIDMAEAFSKDRLSTMIRDTPVLTDRFATPRSRDGQNRILHKVFRGGHVTLAGANSPASLASRPVRLVLLDEIDRYPQSAGAEGDPVTLAKARAKTFPNRKYVLTSTPTIKGASQIERAFEASDKRRYHVPCPDCGEFQVMVWDQVKSGEDANTARYACKECGALWEDRMRYQAISKGVWRAEQPFTGTAGFHLSELCSPWSKLSEMVSSHREAIDSRDDTKIRAWTNTVLGESYEDVGDRPDEGSMMARAERWEDIPEEVMFTTAGVDVQDTRLELELVGWGSGEESWSLEYRTFMGDPAQPQVWADLDEYLLEKKPAVTCVDSGGHHTQAVYSFCRERYGRRVYAIKGIAGAGRSIWPRAVTRRRKGVMLFVIGVDSAKDSVFSRARLQTPGPGYMHVPLDRDAEWYSGLISETVQTTYHKGFPKRGYVRRAGVRNEPLDCRVYAYAALCSLGRVNWNRLTLRKDAKRRGKDSESTEQAPKQVEHTPESVENQGTKVPRPQAYAPRRRPGAGWVNGWKR